MRFILVCDADRERSLRYKQAVAALLQVSANLKWGRCDWGEVGIVWAGSQEAPIDWAKDDKSCALRIGRPVDEHGEVVTAARIHASWEQNGHEPYDGYYAVVKCWSDAIVVCADVLGLFPVYYVQAEGVTLVGTSPELFRVHPAVRLRLEPAALVATLLMNGNGALGRESIAAGVRRLGPGNALVVRQTAEEVPQYRLPSAPPGGERGQGDVTDEAIEMLGNAVRRQAGDISTLGLLLSGGLDSRTLAGYCCDLGRRTIAFTSGWPADIEVQCAARVGAAVGVNRHRVVAPDFGQFAAHVLRLVTEQQVGNGLNCELGYVLEHDAAALPEYAVTGLVLDGVLGGDNWNYAAPRRDDFRFEVLFQVANRWGWSPESLRRLLRPELHSHIDSEVERLRALYDSYEGSDYHKSWKFQLQNRQRLHIGACLWSLAASAWPIVPALDRRLLDFAAGLPWAAVRDRKLQRDILCRRFPELAALPLDRNTFYTAALVPSADSASVSVEPGCEQRYYYNLMDFNTTWRHARQLAEAGLPSLKNVLNLEEMGSVLPRADEAVSFEDMIAGSASRKLMVGLALLWPGRFD